MTSPPPLYPTTVNAKLIVTINGHQCEPLDRELPWQSVEYWDTVQQESEEQASQLRPGNANTQLYRKDARAYLVRREDGTVIQKCSLTSQQDWAHRFQAMVGGAFLQYDFKFDIRLQWTLTVLDLPADDHRLAKYVRKHIHDYLEENWKGESFVPRNVLKAIFQEAIVEKLINNDDSLKDDDLNDPSSGWKTKTKFAEYVFNYGIHLLALFIYSERKLRGLFLLLQKCKTEDLPLTHRSLQKSDTLEGCEECDEPDFDVLRTGQSKFFTHQFNFNSQNMQKTHDLDKEMVVPIQYPRDEEKNFLGEGSFGEVFRVKIHPDHHNSDSVRLDQQRKEHTPLTCTRIYRKSTLSSVLSITEKAKMISN